MSAATLRTAAFAIASIAAIATASAPACATAPWPPDEWVDAAIAAHPDVVAASARVEEADAQAAMLDAGPYDWIGAATGQRRNVTGEPRYREWTLALERTVRLPAKAAADRDAGEAGQLAARAVAADARRRTRRALLEDWFECIEASAVAAQLNAAARTATELVSGVTRSMDAGDGSRLEATQAQAAAALAEADAVTGRHRADAGAMRSRTWLPDTDCRATPLPPPPTPVRIPTDAARDPEVLAARSAGDVAAATARRSRADRLPDPTLTVSYGRERGGADRIAALSIGMPIPGARRAAEAARAAAAARIASAEADRALRSAERVRLGARSDAERAHARWQALADAANDQEEAARLHWLAYQHGESDLGPALSSRRSASLARADEIAARAQAWRAMAVERALTSEDER